MKNTTVTVLKGMAKEMNIAGVSNMKKAELEVAIREVLVGRLVNALGNRVTAIESVCTLPPIKERIVMDRTRMMFVEQLEMGTILTYGHGEFEMISEIYETTVCTGSFEYVIDLKVLASTGLAHMDYEVGTVLKKFSLNKAIDLMCLKEDKVMNRLANVETIIGIDDGELGAPSKNKSVADDIPTPINNVETKKEDVVVEVIKEVVEQRFDVVEGYVPGVYVQSVKTNACFNIAKIEPNGMYKLLDCKQHKSWIRPDVISDITKYIKITKEEAYKVIETITKTTQSPVVNKDIKKETVKTNDIKIKAIAAGEFAKTNFKFRIEQANNFRQMFVIDNATGKKYQVGVGATVAGRVMEYEASNGVKVIVDRASDNKAKYNPNVKHSDVLCVECQKLGKKHYISVAELKYLNDNTKFISAEYANKGLCYQHQATTGVKRAIIQGRRLDASVGNTDISNSKSLLR